MHRSDKTSRKKIKMFSEGYIEEDGGDSQDSNISDFTISSVELKLDPAVS